MLGNISNECLKGSLTGKHDIIRETVLLSSLLIAHIVFFAEENIESCKNLVRHTALRKNFTLLIVFFDVLNEYNYYSVGKLRINIVQNI